MSVLGWFTAQLSSFRGCMYFLTILHICLLALICRLTLHQHVHSRMPEKQYTEDNQQPIKDALASAMHTVSADMDIAARLVNTIGSNPQLFNKVLISNQTVLTNRDRVMIRQQEGPAQLLSDISRQDVLGNLRVFSFMNTVSLAESIQVVAGEFRVMYPAVESFHPAYANKTVEETKDSIILYKKYGNVVVSARIRMSSIRKYLHQFRPVYVKIANLHIQFVDKPAATHHYSLDELPLQIGVETFKSEVHEYSSFIEILDLIHIVAIVFSLKIIHDWYNKYIGSIVKLNNILSDTLEHSFQTSSNHKIHSILNTNQTIQHLCSRFKPMVKGLKPANRTVIRQPAPEIFQFSQQLHSVLSQLKDKMAQHLLMILTEVNSNKAVTQHVNEHFGVREKEYKYLFRENTNKRQLPIFFKYAYNSLFLTNEQFRQFTLAHKHQADEAVCDYFEDTNVLLRCTNADYVSQHPDSPYHQVCKTASPAIKQSLLLRCQGLLLSKVYFLIKDSDPGLKYCRGLGMLYQADDIEIEIENGRYQMAEMTKLKNSM